MDNRNKATDIERLRAEAAGAERWVRFHFTNGLLVYAYQVAREFDTRMHGTRCYFDTVHSVTDQGGRLLRGTSVTYSRDELCARVDLTREQFNDVFNKAAST